MEITSDCFRIFTDNNGNRRVGVLCGCGFFSIKTNGNLPETHSTGVGDWTAGEVRGYVARFGTARQRKLMGV